MLQYGNPCPPAVFVRIPSGRERLWQPSGELGADLDSPALVRKTCLPLPLGLIGPFTAPTAPLVTSLLWPDKLTVVSQNESPNSYTIFLESCGSEPRIPVLSATFGAYSWMVSANRHVLTWWVAGKRLDGILIPSLRRFHLALPVVPKNHLGEFTGAVNVTSTQVYLLDSEGRIWAATLPR
jgi:hypothetical protein